ncbi:hypothetical protein BHM03_00055414 [Ensete ventricosum]|nr:hypothetical protein BHM03_00055414 [Ensete ventricosum]
MRHGRAASLITCSSTLVSDRCCCGGVIVAAVAVIRNGTLLQLPLGVLLPPSFEKPGDVPGAAGVDRGCQAHTGEWERDVLLPRFRVITLGHVVMAAGARARRQLVAISSCVGLVDLLLEVCVPVVLDIIICSPGKVSSYGCPSDLEIKPQRNKAANDQRSRPRAKVAPASIGSAYRGSTRRGAICGHDARLPVGAVVAGRGGWR